MKNIAVVLFGIAVLATGAQAQQASAKPDIDKGQAIVKQICFACHGIDGSSTSPANPKLAGQIFEYLHKQLADFKANAERKNVVMLAMAANLSDADMQNVAAYYAGQKPRSVDAQGKGAFSLGRDIYRGGIVSKSVPACAACHRPDGGGMPASYPRLAGQFVDYTEEQLKAFRSGERSNDANKVMRSIAARMTDKEILAVASYNAALP